MAGPLFSFHNFLLALIPNFFTPKNLGHARHNPRAHLNPTKFGNRRNTIQFNYSIITHFLSIRVFAIIFFRLLFVCGMHNKRELPPRITGIGIGSEWTVVAADEWMNELRRGGNNCCCQPPRVLFIDEFPHPIILVGIILLFFHSFTQRFSDVHSLFSIFTDEWMTKDVPPWGGKWKEG
jgi:hypothetical protein